MLYRSNLYISIPAHAAETQAYAGFCLFLKIGLLNFHLFFSCFHVIVNILKAISGKKLD